MPDIIAIAQTSYPGGAVDVTFEVCPNAVGGVCACGAPKLHRFETHGAGAPVMPDGTPKPGWTSEDIQGLTLNALTELQRLLADRRPSEPLNAMAQTAASAALGRAVGAALRASL